MGACLLILVTGSYHLALIDMDNLRRTLISHQASGCAPVMVYLQNPNATNATTGAKGRGYHRNRGSTSAADFRAEPGILLGVDPIYVELFEEAKRRSARDYWRSHKLGERGIVIGPTDGNFERYTLKALQNGRRIRNIILNGGIGDGIEMKLALMTSPEHISMLMRCPDLEMEEACLLWANGTLFDHVISVGDPPYNHNDNNTNLDQGTSKYWLKALGGYRNAPYKHSLFLDSDAYPCPGIDKLFTLTAPNGPNGKFWQLPISTPGDLAIGMDQYPAWQNNM